jgi:outer membrane protein OmpA-like peptidoglycan-associated protein
MTETRRMSKCRAAVAVAALAMLFAGRGPASAADPLTSEQIVKALTPITTRSLTLAPADSAGAAEKKLLDSLRNRPAHSLTPGEREQIAAAAALKPSIDIDINFDYRSAKISRSTAAAAVNTLGKALSNPDLKGTTFVLAGHTDGKGSLPYNQELSEKRVDTVRQYLVSHFKLSPTSLVAVGYGKTKLKNETDPFGPENRRVQVVNMAGGN